MITRPLDLASRLRPPPRNFDALFYVNVGLLALFFMLFGSRFVLAPGLGIDFHLPRMAGAAAGATVTTCEISVKSSGQILTNDGLLNMALLPEWLKTAASKDARKDVHPVLLIVASESVALADITKINSMALAAGFASVQVALDEPAAKSAGGR